MEKKTYIEDRVYAIVERAFQNKEVSNVMKLVLNYDKPTYEHCIRVAHLSCHIGLLREYDDSKLIRLVKGALLHDCGKIFIPLNILNKPDFLKTSEYEVIKKHPRSGYDLLVVRNFEKEILDIVLHHHECLDGSGYPDRLQREQLSEEVQIVCMCDVWDAMTSHKTYREAYSENVVYEYGFNSGNFTLFQLRMLNVLGRDLAYGKNSGAEKES